MSHSLLHRLFPRDLHHIEGLHRTLARYLPESGCVLDLGCGDNQALAPYRTPSREVWGADFAAHPGLHDPQWFRLLGTDGTIPFADGSCDAIVSIMVLEHVEDPVRFFQEVARVLRSGGHFIGHTISGSHYVTYLRRLFGLLPHWVSQMLVKRLYGRAEVDTFPAHYRLNTVQALQRHSRNAGLVPLELQRYADPGYFHFAAPLETLAIMTDRFMESLVPGCGRLYLTFTGRKP